MKKPKFPSHVRITSKVTYEVLFNDQFKDDTQVGEARLDDKQIIIKKDQSNTELLKTFIHEVVHTMSHEYEIGLTESQVQKLELSIYKYLRLNNLL